MTEDENEFYNFKRRFFLCRKFSFSLVYQREGEREREGENRML